MNQAKRLFTDRIERLRQAQREDHPEDAVLAQLCSDERAESTWNLTADLPDDWFYGFIDMLLTARAAGPGAAEQAAALKESREVVEEAQVRLNRLVETLRRWPWASDGPNARRWPEIERVNGRPSSVNLASMRECLWMVGRATSPTG